MIPKIGLALTGNNIYKNYTNKNNVTYKKSQSSGMSVPSGLKSDCFVFFGAKKGLSENENSKLQKIMYSADTSAKSLIAGLKKEAADSGYSQITTMHVLRHALVDADKYIDTLNAIKKEPKVKPPLVDILANEINSELFSKKEYRDDVQKIIKDHIKNVDDILAENMPSSTKNTEVSFSEDMLDAIWATREDENDVVTPWLIIFASWDAQDETTIGVVDDIVDDLSSRVMRNNKPLSERKPFSDFEPKAEKSLKNISLGNNIFLTYDPQKDSPASFLDTINKVNKKKYGDKFEIIELNYKVKDEYLDTIIERTRQNPDKEYIIAVSPSAIIANYVSPIESPNGTSVVPPSLISNLIEKPENVKFILYDAKANYYSLASAPPFNAIFSDYEETALPMMSTAQMIKYFRENPSEMDDIKKTFSKNAIDRVVEASTTLDGVFPTKTKELMTKVANYYSDKKAINERDIENYLEEAVDLLKKDKNDSSVDVIFDTGKRLKDLIGKESTQKEAAILVKQIKSGKLGTKGVILYSQDGFPGGGRRFTAKAIAGEAHVPYIEINAVDFGTKEVDLFGGNILSPEAAVKQLFATVKTQAEANPNKSAMLFIENFEYFSVGELVSMYHEKAMAQLLREMDKARDQGLNILVAGSVSKPNLIGEATMKSFKFVDTIEVASPAYNKEARENVIEKTLKSSKIKIAGSLDERKAVISYVSDITMSFSFIELKSLIKKACSVAEERGHKQLNKGDFTEAYLQLTTGRPSLNKIHAHEKRIVTSHECGHATNLEVMNNIAKEIGKPWHIPSKVNFITLDPRGMYGGAVYHGDDVNNEYSFENVFASIVCSFGGYSAEKHFYGMDGSYGISADMESARNVAEVMVRVMGLGTKTGKMAIGRGENISDSMKQRIEDDERVILNNAQITSDLITDMYSGFNEWFTEKYSPLVGTGDCLIDGDTFRDALKQWRAEQTPDVQRKLQLCDETIVKIMNATKRGAAVRKAN